jgi:hypothetical protein
MSEHSWCRDIPRDEAVRASEDGRKGPLPTLEQAISAVTERRPPEPGGGGNVTGGLRTQRVTLSLARMGELIAERDAAIRERDNLRAERITQALTADRFAAAVAESDTLKARVAELTQQTIKDHALICKISDERDAAIRERDALKARVAELEADVADCNILFGDRWREAVSAVTGKAAPAASGAAVDPVLRDARLRDESRTEAYVASLDDASGAAGTATWFAAVGKFGMKNVCMAFNSFEECDKFADGEVPIVLLYAAPQPAPGWLTEEEREAMTLAAQQAPESDFVTTVEGKWINKTLTALLARETPPEVVLPEFVADEDSHTRDHKWIAALAAVGVAAKEVG